MEFRRWRGRAAALLALVLLSACAELPCEPNLCTPAEWDAQTPLTLEPIPYEAIFGPQRTGAVSVEPEGRAQPPQP